MNCNTIETKLLKVLSTILKQPFTSPHDIGRSNTPGWDSLKHLEIMFALEEELGVEFTTEELAALDSAIKIIAAIEAKHAP